MKTILLTVTLLGSICLRADPGTSAASTEAEAGARAVRGEQALQGVQSAGEGADHRVVDQDQRTIQFAQATIGVAEEAEPADTGELPGFFNHGINLAFSSAGRGAVQPLIVRSGPMEPKALGSLQEDLTVMSRILTKAVEREQGREKDSAMGIVLSQLPGSRRPQSIYLEGYGALFLIPVKVPLLPSGSKEDEKSEKAPDTTWELTKRELYVTGDKPGTARIWDIPASSNEAPFNVEQVESLKKELVEALKNASNIREVKANESITVAVLGSRAASSSTRVKRVSKNTGNNRRSEVYAVAEPNRQAPVESTLSLRAKKSDVDAFAKGELDLEQFTKRVSIAIY